MAVIKIAPPQKFNMALRSCWETLQGGRSITVYRCLVDITGSVKAAAMLSQLIYWTRVSRHVAERDGWIYKSIAEMEAETGLTKYEQNTCKRRLRELNLISTSRKNFGANLALRVNLDELSDAVCRQLGVQLPQENLISIESLQNQTSLFFRRYFGERVSYHRDLVDITGCVHAAIMLSAVLKESMALFEKIADDRQHAYASLTIENWLAKLGLSYKAQLNARNRLKNLKLISEKHFIASRRIFTLANSVRIIDAVRKKLSCKSEAPPPRKQAQKPVVVQFGGKGDFSLAERANSVWRKGRIVENQEVRIDLTPQSRNMTFRSCKRVNWEVAKGQIGKVEKGKLRKCKTGNWEVAKGQIVIYTNYKMFLRNINNYNKKDARSCIPRLQQTVNSDVVVVGESVYDKLVYPRCLAGKNRKQAEQIFLQLYPDARQEQLQEILDEIAGQTKPVTSPLGLLMKLTKLAVSGHFLALVAPEVKRLRECLPQPVPPADTGGGKAVTPEVAQNTLGNISQMLKTKKHGCKS